MNLLLRVSILLFALIFLQLTAGEDIRTSVKAAETTDVTPPSATGSNAPSSVNYSNASYEVYVYGVKDQESGVKEVKFPTWTEANGQDDIIWYTGTDMGSGTWKVVIPFSNHNNQSGLYQTHIYGYDYAGNSGFLGGYSIQVVRTTSNGGYSYYYDNSERLTYDLFPSGNFSNYRYDLNGNLMKKIVANTRAFASSYLNGWEVYRAADNDLGTLWSSTYHSSELGSSVVARYLRVFATRLSSDDGGGYYFQLYKLN
jgi:YD repeat-containing protein